MRISMKKRIPEVLESFIILLLSLCGGFSLFIWFPFRTIIRVVGHMKCSHPEIADFMVDFIYLNLVFDYLACCFIFHTFCRFLFPKGSIFGSALENRLFRTWMKGIRRIPRKKREKRVMRMLLIRRTLFMGYAREDEDRDSPGNP